MDATVLMEFLAGRVCAVVLALVEVMDRPVQMVLPVTMDQWVPVDLMEPWELPVSEVLLELMEPLVKRVQRDQLVLLAPSVSGALLEALARMAIRVLPVIPVLMAQRDLLVLLVPLEPMAHRALKYAKFMCNFNLLLLLMVIFRVIMTKKLRSKLYKSTHSKGNRSQFCFHVFCAVFCLEVLVIQDLCFKAFRFNF